MLRIATLVILVLAACGPRAAPDAPASGSRNHDEVVAAARGVVESWRQGWEVRSPDALRALYPHDLDVIVVDQGRAQLGWTNVETYLSTKLAPAKEIHIKLDDLQVFALGSDAAAVSAVITRETSDGVASVKETGMITMAIRADADGKWLIVSEHYSYPPSAQ
jgi:ketosteroid isomerase-like protein